MNRNVRPGRVELVLASSSPRRRELLRRLGLVFEVLAPGSEVEGPLPERLSPAEAVQEASRLAAAKALDVAARVEPDTLVVGADTLVLLGEVALGKPASPEDAARMLRLLAGRDHLVVTGVAVVRGQRVEQGAETTRVWFRPLEEQEIAAYVRSGEPMDKAGAYGIQDLGSLLVSRIEGDFYNVMGLPLVLLHRLLRRQGLDLLA
jgi:septum formation protein